MSGLRRFSYGMTCLLAVVIMTSAKADDPLRSLTQDLVLGILDRDALALSDEDLRNLAEERARVLIDNARSQTGMVRRVAIPDAIINLIDTPLLKYIEEHVELEGHLTTTFFEYDELSHAHFLTLQPANGSDTVFLHFDGPPPSLPLGRLVRVQGILLPNVDEGTDGSVRHMVVLGSDGDVLEVLSEASVITAPPSAGRQRTGVFLASFSDDPASLTNIAYAREWVFAQLDNVLRRHSLGRAWLSRTGVEQLELATTQTCDREKIQQELFHALALSGRGITAYDRIFLILPSLECEWRTATVFPGSPNVILVNEMPAAKGLLAALLHGLGMLGHQVASCDFDVVHSECQSRMESELGQPSEIGAISLSPYHKERLSWMSVGDSGGISTVDSGGMYRIWAADAIYAEGRPLALKIERPAPLLQGGTTYYVEYRVRKLDGKRLPPEVVLYIVSSNGVAETLSLTSPHPVQDELQDAISLSEGRFIDHAAGLEIEVAGLSPWLVDLDISFDPTSCVPAAPDIEIAPSGTPYLSPESSIRFSIAASNRDSSDCEPLRPNLQLQVPNGWIVHQDAEIPMLQPDETIETEVLVTIPPTEVPGFRELEWIVQGGAPMVARRPTMLFIMPTMGGDPEGALHRVSEYGAKCTGSSDDTAALQHALNALGNGETLLFDKGLCGVGPAGLTLIGKSNITIKGMGRGTGFRALARPATNAGLSQFGWGPMMIEVIDCDKCTFRDLEFDLNHKETGAIIFYALTNSLVENNYFHWGKASSTYDSYKTEAMIGLLPGHYGGRPGRKNVWGKNNKYRHNEIEDTCCGPNSIRQRGFFLSGEEQSVIEYNKIVRSDHTSLACQNCNGVTARRNLILNGRYPSIKFADNIPYNKQSRTANDMNFVVDNVSNSSVHGGLDFQNIVGITLARNTFGGPFANVHLKGLNNGSVTPQLVDVTIENNVFCGQRSPGGLKTDPDTHNENVVIRDNTLLANCSAVDFTPPEGVGNYAVGASRSPPGAAER